MTALSVSDFEAFFEALHGYTPFPWQSRLARLVAREARWPEVLELPTGAGKTSVIDIAVFHLALEAGRSDQRRAPVRIAFVVDRRLVVDDAFIRSRRLATKLATAEGDTVLGRVAASLDLLSGGGPPLIARRLRGGVPREDDWARTPAQPTVLCSTVDQIGSRLLFRGYGISDRMKPVHAGLLGGDCIILLDEAHTAEPFRQTLQWIARYHGAAWQETRVANETLWQFAMLTATPAERGASGFYLDETDLANDVLSMRVRAPKPVRLASPVNVRRDAAGAEVPSELDAALVERLVEEVIRALTVLDGENIGPPAIGAVVNRVATARAAFEKLRTDLRGRAVRLILMIGPARTIDRDVLLQDLEPLRTEPVRQDQHRSLELPMVIVATQCIEVGVDIDLDGLISELAPIDALRQRFGRVNRSGRAFNAYGAIIASRVVLGARYVDPVYGRALKPTWDYLNQPEISSNRDDGPLVDFGIDAMKAKLEAYPAPPDTATEKEPAPVLTPAHLDLLSQTSPIPAVDPVVSLYLHGLTRQPDSITVAWRADIDANIQNDEKVRRLLTILPPRVAEVIELPRWAVVRWLEGSGVGTDALADTPGAGPDPEEDSGVGRTLQVFRWLGDDDKSTWIPPRQIRSGDAVVVPAGYGGVDGYGWNPRMNKGEYASDVADAAGDPYQQRRYVVRVAPGLLEAEGHGDGIADALANTATGTWQDARAVLLALGLGDVINRRLLDLDLAKGGPGAVKLHRDLYGLDEHGRPRGAVFVAERGVRREGAGESPEVSSTEDDLAGSVSGYALTLEQHSMDVEHKSAEFARLAGLPEDRVVDLQIAGYLHDAGKADPRFQAWLRHDDPLGPDLDDSEQVLAKSARSLPRRARRASGLPDHWRHEALSVRLARQSQRLSAAPDPELVLWLIGSHHGYGRPFFPHGDSEDQRSRELPAVLGLARQLPAGAGPQSLRFDLNGADWSRLFERLKSRYGIWELARMEAILRLADHRASDDAARLAVSAGEAP